MMGICEEIIEAVYMYVYKLDVRDLCIIARPKFKALNYVKCLN